MARTPQMGRETKGDPDAKPVSWKQARSPMPQRSCPRESPWLQSLYLLSRTGQISGGECSEGLGDRKTEENEDTVLGVRPPMVVGV